VAAAVVVAHVDGKLMLDSSAQIASTQKANG
jgi:hypothetical protein